MRAIKKKFFFGAFQVVLNTSPTKALYVPGSPLRDPLNHLLLGLTPGSWPNLEPSPRALPPLQGLSEPSSPSHTPQLRAPHYYLLSLAPSLCSMPQGYSSTPDRLPTGGPIFLILKASAIMGPCGENSAHTDQSNQSLGAALLSPQAFSPTPSKDPGRRKDLGFVGTSRPNS